MDTHGTAVGVLGVLFRFGSIPLGRIPPAVESRRPAARSIELNGSTVRPQVWLLPAVQAPLRARVCRPARCSTRVAVITFATVGSTSFVLIDQYAGAEAAWVTRASPLQFSRCHSTWP